MYLAVASMTVNRKPAAIISRIPISVCRAGGLALIQLFVRERHEEYLHRSSRSLPFEPIMVGSVRLSRTSCKCDGKDSLHSLMAGLVPRLSASAFQDSFPRSS